MDRSYIIYKLLRAVFKPLFHILYRPVIVGREYIPKNGAVVIAGNHKHALDPILVDVCTKRVVHTLAKKELHDGRFGAFFRGAGTIPVDLHSAHNPAALDAAIKVLQTGGMINVSPEAKRNYTNELLLPFKFGAAVMSHRTGAPVIPYAITGEYRLFRRGIKIVFGAPVHADGREPDDINRELYDTIAGLLRDAMPDSQRDSRNFTSYDEWRDRS